MSQNFQEYPKQMNHPQHRPAVIAKWDHSIKDPKEQPQGSPERFPPVVVHNFDQEQQYAAKGYTPSGKSDPEAYRRAMTGNDKIDRNAILLYPKWLYRVEKPGAEEVEAKLVQTEVEEKALGPGWHPTPDAARNAPVEVKAAAKAEKPRVEEKIPVLTEKKSTPLGRKSAGKAKRAEARR